MCWVKVPPAPPTDFDGSGKVDLNDAIYLLYHVNFSTQYSLYETEKDRERMKALAVFLSKRKETPRISLFYA